MKVKVVLLVLLTAKIQSTSFLGCINSKENIVYNPRTAPELTKVVTLNVETGINLLDPRKIKNQISDILHQTHPMFRIERAIMRIRD